MTAPSDATAATPPLAQIDHLLVTVQESLPDALVAKLKQVSKHVYLYADNQPPASVLSVAQVVFCSMRGLPKSVTDIRAQMPALRLIQNVNSGANLITSSQPFQDPDVRRLIPVCNTSGLHTTSIPGYVLSTVLMLYLRLNEQYLFAQQRASWCVSLPNPDGSPYFARSLYGKTVGLLGYGKLGRETARLFSSAFHCTIIAANTSGLRTVESNKYSTGDTGDSECLLSIQMYSTRDSKAFNQFLGQSEILIASLPDTSETKYMLQDHHFQNLPRDAVFVNVGRGNLVSSQVLLKALNRDPTQANGALLGLVADVTDPEPLPDGHPLYTHPKAIITPHLSGTCKDQFKIATEICVQNVIRMATQHPFLNVVDLDRGY